jgi:hypothetical protein
MPADQLPVRGLGYSGIEVSALSLGSWRTYERLDQRTGIRILRAAREEGITFFDDARYNDETGQAPIPTGFSEVVFGSLFRGAGLRRDEVVMANKLWWEFWPEQTAADELEASLGRMGFDSVDLIYASAPPDGMPVADLVEAVGGLIATGKARAWGVLNWPAGSVTEAAEAAGRHVGACALRRAAAIQSGAEVAGRGSLNDTRARPGQSRSSRLVLPGGRGAERQIPDRAGARPRRGDAGRGPGGPRTRGRSGTGQPRRAVRDDPGGACPRLRLGRPGSVERAVRRHKPRTGAG